MTHYWPHLWYKCTELIIGSTIRPYHLHYELFVTVTAVTVTTVTIVTKIFMKVNNFLHNLPEVFRFASGFGL